MLRWSGLLVCVFIVSTTFAARAPLCEPPGEFKLYSMMSPAGGIASCTYSYDEGRHVRQVFYRPSLEWPNTGLRVDPSVVVVEELVVWEITERHNDAEGRLVRSDSFSADGRLTRSWGQVYGEDGSVTQEYFDSSRRLVKRILKGKNRPRTTLVYGPAGERVIGVSGAMDERIAEGWRWGEPVDGASCAAVGYRLEGQLEAIGIQLTLWNRSDTNVLLPGAGFLDRTIDLALDRPDGERVRVLLPQDLLPRTGTPRELGPGQAATVNIGRFGRWFPDLPSGEYDVLVRYRLAFGRESPLCSPTLRIIVE